VWIVPYLAAVGARFVVGLGQRQSVAPARFTATVTVPRARRCIMNDYGLETWVSYDLEQDTAGDADLVAGTILAVW
jgi:hypothetical protein